MVDKCHWQNNGKCFLKMLPMGAITDEREQDLGQSLGEPPVRNSMNSMLVQT